MRIALKFPYMLTLDGHPWVRLSRQQALLLFALMGHKEVSKELAAEILWPNPDVMPDAWSDAIKVLVCLLRASIGPRWKISTRHNFGYTLEPTCG